MAQILNTQILRVFWILWFLEWEEHETNLVALSACSNFYRLRFRISSSKTLAIQYPSPLSTKEDTQNARRFPTFAGRSTRLATMLLLRMYQLFILSLLFSLVQSMPIWLLKSGDIKCIDLEAAQDTVLMVDYDGMGTHNCGFFLSLLLMLLLLLK